MYCVRSLSTSHALLVVLKKTSVDGSGFLLFFRHLSQLYQGLGPIDPPPYYEPEAIKFPEPPKAPSPVSNRFETAPPQWKQPERKGMEFVAFRLTAAQLTEIHKSVTKGIEHPRITRMDAVTGLLARCLSEVEPESKPIDTISYVVNVRTLLASRTIRLTSPSTAEWAYIHSMRRSTRWACSTSDCSARKGPMRTTTF